MPSTQKPSVLSGVCVLNFGHERTRSPDRIAALTQSGVLVQEPFIKEFRERGAIQ